MIDYEKLKLGMMTDKHIDQWATYIIEELPAYREFEGNKALFECMIHMYKKGFEDCIQTIQSFAHCSLPELIEKLQEAENRK